MINGIETKKTLKLTCADCGAVLELEVVNKDDGFEYVRKTGGAISRDRQKYYCPNCAPHHRHVGKYGLRRANVQTRISNV